MRSVTEKRSEKALKDYYSRNFFYRNTRSLHYPIWNEETKKYRQASENTNKVVIKELNLKKGDTVLDAGCGVGGTTIYIAEHHPVTAVGITIVPSQIERAKNYAHQSTAANRINFLLKDYTKTGFKPNSFDKIFGIESICHAVEKKDFINEAFRILKPGGRLVVLDAFRIKNKLTSKESRIYNEFLDGFALDNIASKDRFGKSMKKAGFKDIHFKSQNAGVTKTLDYYYTFGALVLPIVYLLEKANLTHGSLGHIIAARNSKFLIENQVLEYGLFSGKK
jgi:tocopherol O-methyltransferase